MYMCFISILCQRSSAFSLFLLKYSGKAQRFHREKNRRSDDPIAAAVIMATWNHEAKPSVRPFVPFVCVCALKNSTRWLTLFSPRSLLLSSSFSSSSSRLYDNHVCVPLCFSSSSATGEYALASSVTLESRSLARTLAHTEKPGAPPAR